MNEFDLARVKELELPRVGQLSFVVADAATMLPKYAASYNIGTWYRPKFVENQVQYEGRQYNAEWEILYGYSGQTQLELIDVRGDGENIFGEFLDEQGPGLHHLGFYLSGLDEKVARAEGAGIQVVHRATLRTPGGFMARVAFLDGRPLCGAMLELIEVRMAGLRLPPSRWVMEVGVLLGDGEKIKV